MKADIDRRPSAADTDAVRAVPVIDIGNLDAGEQPNPRAVRQIRTACQDWGFFQIVNHGIDRALIDEIWSHTQSFFALPVSEKEQVLRTRKNPWGYYNNELTKNQRDKKEVFDFTSGGIDPIYRSENRWPDFDRGFQHVMERYRDECAGLATRVLEAMCVGLGLEARYLNPLFAKESTSFTRLNYYPVDDPMAGRGDVEHLEVADLGVHHHTDAGALTLLMQDAVGGLQVFRDGLWYDVPPRRDAFVVNTGDMMQVWSNDRYRAATHRVLAMQSTDRYSIPFFFNPTAEATVGPLPSVISDSQPARYRAINWGEFRSRRTDGDYADYGSEVQIDQFRTD